jgi:hypothetical protein
MARIFGICCVIGGFGSTGLWLFNMPAFAAWGPLLVSVGAIGLIGLVVLMSLHRTR